MLIDSLITRLERQLQEIENQTLELLDASTIERDPDPSPWDDERFVLIANRNHWGDSDEAQKRLQLKILRLYSSWFEHLRLLFHGSSQETQKQISETDKAVKEWIEKKDGWGVPSSIVEAKDSFKKNLQSYYQLLQLFKSSGKAKTILVPDTNAFIMCPDVVRFAESIGQADYTVVLIPTVLSELDTLKRDHRDKEFRNKVDSVIRRLKGLRQQGDLREGVTVNKTVKVKWIGNEPNFNETLSWLDPDNNDDRIIASILEIQRDEPSSIVILLSHDINHQNKADMANVPYVEPPEPKPVSYV